MSDSVFELDPVGRTTSPAPQLPPPSEVEADVDATPGESWTSIVERLQRSFPAVVGEHPCPVAIGLKAGTLVVQAVVPMTRLGTFLRAVGGALANAGHVDALFWLQRRNSMARDGHESVHGVVVDVDTSHHDFMAVIVDNGLELPAFWYRAHSGTKLLYVFDGAAPDVLAHAFAARVALGVPGADLEAVALCHGHRLPVVRGSLVDGTTIWSDHHVVPVSVAPIAIGNWSPMLPQCLTDSIQMRTHLSSSERDEIEAHLQRRGLAVPAEGTSAAFANCPENIGHDEPCCYVYRREGRISVSCHGAHGSVSRQRAWTEGQLLALARGRAAVTVAADVTVAGERRQALPLTWAAVRILEQRLRDVPDNGAERRRLAQTVLVAAAAVALARDCVTEEWPLAAALKPAVRLMRARLDGVDPDVGPVRPFFDRRRHQVRLLGEQDAPRAIGLRQLCNFKRSTHLWHATTAMTVEPGTAVFAQLPYAQSRFSLAESGDPQALAALGVPLLNVEPFPAAYAETHFDVDSDLHSLIIGDVVPTLPDTDFDVVTFFLGLFRAGRLPLVDEGDVRRYIMLIAAPLVRRLAPGQQGIYLVTGPSGAGKDFLIGLAIDTHSAVVSSGERAGFEVSIDSDSERKRTFAAGAGKLYARIKEAGKRGRDRQVDNLLVRLTGSSDVPARAIGRDEVTLPNGFVYVVDALEGISSRVELARRTVTISASTVGDETALGETSSIVLKHATQIVAALKRLVETEPQTYYTQQSATDSRPVLQVALARLLGVDLATVRGADLEDIWAAFAAYVTERAATEHQHTAKLYEGREKKDGPLPTLFACARLAQFLSTMARDGAFSEVLKFNDAQALANHITREARYDPRKADAFVLAKVGTREWVFRLFKDNRHFIFVPRDLYEEKMGREAPAGIAGPAVAPGIAGADVAPGFAVPPGADDSKWAAPRPTE